MMNIQLNGQMRQFNLNLNLSELLEIEALSQRRVAVEVNGQIIPRSQHAQWLLHDGDRVEIVHALGGG